jgi:hypothetical protein
MERQCDYSFYLLGEIVQDLKIIFKKTKPVLRIRVWRIAKGLSIGGR